MVCEGFEGSLGFLLILGYLVLLKKSMTAPIATPKANPKAMPWEGDDDFCPNAYPKATPTAEPIAMPWSFLLALTFTV